METPVVTALYTVYFTAAELPAFHWKINIKKRFVKSCFYVNPCDVIFIGTFSK